MTRILRGESAATLIAPLPARQNSPVPQVPADSEKARLSARIAELEAALIQSEKQRQSDVQKAKTEATAAALSEAEKRHKALSMGFAKAQENLKARFADLDLLAAALVRTALAKVFHDSDRRAEDVLSAISKWSSDQARSAQVTIRISKEDFGAIGEDRLAEALGDQAEHVRADKTLSAGECVIETELGSVNLAPLSQWQELEKTFQLMLQERGA